MIIKVEYDAAKQETIFTREVRVPDPEINGNIADWLRRLPRDSTNNCGGDYWIADMTDDEWADICSRSTTDE